MRRPAGRITCPLASRALPDNPVWPPSPDRGAPMPADILIVDDDPDTFTSLSRFLDSAIGEPLGWWPRVRKIVEGMKPVKVSCPKNSARPPAKLVSDNPTMRPV